MSEESPRAAAREALLLAALAHVPFDGWSEAALRAGEADARLPEGSLARLFPGGAREAVDAFGAWADARMAARVRAADLSGARLHERVAFAVRARIEALAPHREAVRRALAFLAMPQNAPLAAQCLARSADAIWQEAGDRAADFSWYTKRATLAAILAATVLYWLEDETEGYSATWGFLDRRLADVGRLGRLRGRIEEAAERLPDPFALLRGRAPQR